MTPAVDTTTVVHASRELHATFATLVREDGAWDVRIQGDTITATAADVGSHFWLRTPDAPPCKAHCVLVVRNGKAHLRRLSVTVTEEV